MYDSDEYGEGGHVRGAFEAILDGSREPALPSVTDAAVAGGRRIRRRRTAVSGAVGVVVAAVLTAGAVAALPGAEPGRSSVPLAPVSGPPPTTTGPASPSAVPSEPSAVPTPSGGASGNAPGDTPLTSPLP
ncbi:hypothetical protein OG806_32135 [Streptomyces sp. NBC_00882]|uniref:hypothetical protein n=1 Tax=Streptomyces sp. NBC_00882 TaxID=2975856 RepID=UPI003866C115|nr:hypothetical protein OG806_32135 [Streptomyces sp. NBC_00882]